MKWRVIGPEKKSGFMNLALEEACVESVGSGKSPPTIFFYEWEKPTVIIGQFQKLHDEVDVRECEKDNVDIIRRTTGGGAVYQDERGMTFGYVAPDNMMPKDINENYRHVCGKIVEAFKKLGLDAEFRAINDITVLGKKVSGSAMSRRFGATLVHGTLLHTLDVEKMFKYLKVGRLKISDKGIKDYHERVTSISHHKEISKEDIYSAITKEFVGEKEFYEGSWSYQEVARAKELIEKRYKNKEWTEQK